MSRPGKITANKLIEDRQGIEKLNGDFEGIDLLEQDQELDAFRKVIRKYQIWAATLSALNVLDFARVVEGTLTGDKIRQHLLNYRVEHLRREGIFEKLHQPAAAESSESKSIPAASTGDRGMPADDDDNNFSSVN